MELIFMGTGTSQGVLMIAYHDHACDLDDRRNWRTRTSAHVVMDGHHIQIDAGPEFRLQCLWNQIDQIDTFLLTHGHTDHLMGMDDLRRFCDLLGGNALPIYSSSQGLERIRQTFPYAIGDKPAYKGYPAFALHEMPPVLELPGGTIRHCLLPHGSIQVLGLVFQEASTGKRLAYYTDCKRIDDFAAELAADVDVLVIDGLRHESHPTHLTVAEALEASRRIRAKRTFLTHMTHLIDHQRDSKRLPEFAAFAHDGLRLTV